MSESSQHIELVNIIVNRAKEIVPQSYWPLIAIDSPSSQNIPMITDDGYKPDVLYNFNDIFIIGEAKTTNDIERIHSKKQYLSYIKECALFSGQAFLIIAVPWTEKITMSNLVKQILRREKVSNVHLIILDNISW